MREPPPMIPALLTSAARSPSSRSAAAKSCEDAGFARDVGSDGDGSAAGRVDLGDHAARGLFRSPRS